MQLVRYVANTLVACLVLFALAYGQDEDKIKGLVTQRSSDSMTVQSSDGTQYAVLLTDDTKVRTPKGLGLRHNEESWATLIPGLPVKVKGARNETGQIVASQVEFTKEGLQTANMIQAGLAPTQSQVTANQQNIAKNREAIEDNQQAISENARKVDDRFNALTDYDVKKEVAVYFAPGRSALTEQNKAALSQIASDATKLKGYLIEVKGFADSTGSAAMNQTLSRDRSEAVVAYLMQDCNVPVRHILAPGAMGISNPAASNETMQGRANNRRVELIVMVNKAVGSNAQ